MCSSSKVMESTNGRREIVGGGPVDCFLGTVEVAVLSEAGKDLTERESVREYDEMESK